MKLFLLSYLKYMTFAIGVVLTLQCIVFAVRGLDRFEAADFIASIIFGIIGIPLLARVLLSETNNKGSE